MHPEIYGQLKDKGWRRTLSMSSSPKRRADGSTSASRLSSSRGSLGALPRFLTLKTPSGSSTGKAFDRARFVMASYMILSRRTYWSTPGIDGGGFSKRFEQSVYASYALSIELAAIELNPRVLICCSSSLSWPSSSCARDDVGAVGNGDALPRVRCCIAVSYTHLTLPTTPYV